MTQIKDLFNEIAKYYDSMNDVISLGSHYGIKKKVLNALPIFNDASIVDLCCGTGDFTRIINQKYRDVKIIGVDFSHEMLDIARKKNPSGVFIEADCTNMPFGDSEFDFAIISFGLRNIPDREKAISEIRRVLKPNGKLLHLDFGDKNIFYIAFKFIVPIFILLFRKNREHYRYLIESINRFPQINDLVKLFSQYGLKCEKIMCFYLGAISAQIYINNK